MSPYRPAYRAAGVRGSESIRRRADREIDGDKVFNAKSRRHSYITATTSSALMSMQVRQTALPHPLVLTFCFASNSDKVSYLTIAANTSGYERPYSAH